MRILNQSRWLAAATLLTIAFINAAAFQGTRGIYETTEGRYTECARETQLSGNLSEPILNGQHHWTKPPLTYLAIIASMQSFGPGPWGLRAFLVIAMMLTVAAVWWAGVVIWGRAAGFWAGLVMATSPFIAGIATIVATDMLVTLWAALAITSFWHAHSRQSRAAYLLMWLFLGLGCLTKGPPALLVPLIMITGATLHGKHNLPWRPGGWTALAGISIFLIVGVGWFAWKIWQHPGLGAYWIGHEVIDRNLSDEFKRNPGFGYVLTNYLPIMLFGTGPWLMLVCILGWKEGNRHLLPFKTPATWNGAARWGLTIGTTLPLIIFSVSRSKLPMYLAPLFVPLCLLIGRSLELLIRLHRLRWQTASIMAGVLLLLIVTGKAAAGFPERVRDMTRLAARLAPILAHEHPSPLYLVNGRPVNGLEYHLQQKLEFIPPASLADHMRKQTPALHPPLYLIKKKDWDHLSPNFPLKVTVEDIGPHWSGIRPAY